MEQNKKETYKKLLSNFIDKPIEEEEIIFNEKVFEKVETKDR
jgi:hypothetical protein